MIEDPVEKTGTKEELPEEATPEVVTGEETQVKEEEKEEEEEEHTLLESESKKTASQIAAFLRKLSDNIEKRIVTLKKGDNVITLTLPETLTLEVEVEEEKEGSKVKRSLEIEIEWEEGDMAEEALEL